MAQRSGSVDLLIYALSQPACWLRPGNRLARLREINRSHGFEMPLGGNGNGVVEADFAMKSAVSKHRIR